MRRVSNSGAVFGVVSSDCDLGNHVTKASLLAGPSCAAV